MKKENMDGMRRGVHEGDILDVLHKKGHLFKINSINMAAIECIAVMINHTTEIGDVDKVLSKIREITNHLPLEIYQAEVEIDIINKHNA